MYLRNKKARHKGVLFVFVVCGLYRSFPKGYGVHRNVIEVKGDTTFTYKVLHSKYLLAHKARCIYVCITISVFQ
jgi:hypothetical protein